jgi:probable HAF family extracellular repeat protein
LPGNILSYATAINDAGVVVGYEYSTINGKAVATEWSGGSVIALGGSANSSAYAINDAGQVVGNSTINGKAVAATEWSGGSVIDLGGPNSWATGINDAGQVVGWSLINGQSYATKWSGGSVIDLGSLLLGRRPGTEYSRATGINDAGQVVGEGFAYIFPEPSTWTMMLLGFVGLAFAGYRGAAAGQAPARS